MSKDLPALREAYAEINPDLVLMDGFDHCILGVGSRAGGEQFIIYDYDKVIEELKSQGMTYEDAVEYHEFNQLGAYVGEHTPAFMACGRCNGTGRSL